MEPPAPDIIIWGTSAAGRRFRPSDWAERLAGLSAAFHLSERSRYCDLVEPTTVAGMRAVLVRGALQAAEPRLHQFLLDFARDNDLVTQVLAGRIDSPQCLTPPAPPSGGEPREPV